VFWRHDARGRLGSESRTRLCLRPADGQRLDSFCFFSRVSEQERSEPPRVFVASSSNGFAAGAFLSRPSVSFASLSPTLFRFRDGHFLGDRRGGVVPTLGRASASERFAGGGSACGAVRGATRLPVASGRGFEERISGGETRTKYCCIPYATSAVPHNARVYLSYAFTNFFDAALFPSLSSIASSREPDAARRGLRRETGNGSHRCRDGSELVSRKRATMLARRCRSKYRSVLHRAARVTPRPFPP